MGLAARSALGLDDLFFLSLHSWVWLCFFNFCQALLSISSSCASEPRGFGAWGGRPLLLFLALLRLAFLLQLAPGSSLLWFCAGEPRCSFWRSDWTTSTSFPSWGSHLLPAFFLPCLISGFNFRVGAMHLILNYGVACLRPCDCRSSLDRTMPSFLAIEHGSPVLVRGPGHQLSMPSVWHLMRPPCLQALPPSCLAGWEAKHHLEALKAAAFWDDPRSFYSSMIAPLAIGTAVLAWSAVPKAMDWPEGFRRFMACYLSGWTLAVAADWLQGPYVYALYEAYGYSQAEIAQLFVAGFGSAMVGSCASPAFLGRKRVLRLCRQLSRRLRAKERLHRLLPGLQRSQLAGVFLKCLLSQVCFTSSLVRRNIGRILRELHTRCRDTGRCLLT